MILTRPDAAIIDLDGTLVDTVGDFVSAINLMLADIALTSTPLTVDVATVTPMIGKGSEKLMLSVLAHLAPQAGPGFEPAAHAARALALYQTHYLAINGSASTLYPGAREGLQRLKDADIPMACLTNKPIAFAKPLLAMMGLDGFFSVVFGGDSFERKKPDPLPLRKTCEALGTQPSRTLMVGDSSNDAEAARAAGCPVVLVTYGYNHGAPVRQVDADGFVDSIADIRW